MLNQFVLLMIIISSIGIAYSQKSIHKTTNQRTRVIVTSDGEIDDDCSMVRFLLYANEFDVEGVITSSSQYHWHGHKWAGDDWLNPYLDAYEKVYPNLIKHDKAYPTPKYQQHLSFSFKK